jgi:hypothetical protein
MHQCHAKLNLPRRITKSKFLLLLLVAGIFLLFGRRYASVLANSPASQSPPRDLVAYVTETAKSSDAFVDSIGINTHINYFDRTYGNFALVKAELKLLGIRHVRDGAQLVNSGYDAEMYGRWRQLGTQGQQFDMVFDPRASIKQVTSEVMGKIHAQCTGLVETVEGPNELDISGIPGWPELARAYQTALYESVHQTSGMSAVPVIGPSMAFSANGARLGDMSELADLGNLHPYPGGKSPSVVFPKELQLAAVVYGTRKIIVTETGYHNAIHKRSGQPGVSETAAAKYIPRLFLENFNHGIPRTYLYELLDEAKDPTATDAELHWGLIRADGTEKPAFHAVENLIGLLEDPSSSSITLGTLQYGLSGSLDNIHHVLLQKRDGRFYLVLWQDAVSYDLSEKADTSVPGRELTLVLLKPVRIAKLYRPSVQPSPVEQVDNVTKIGLSVPDHPLVVELEF